MKYLTNEYVIESISFNKDNVEPLNEALLESLVGIIGKILKTLANFFTGNSKKVNSCKQKAGILSKITSNKKIKMNMTQIDGNAGDLKIPAIEDTIYVASAYTKALTSGNPNVMEQTAIELANNKLNYEYKDKFEGILGNTFHIKNLNFFKDDDGDLKLNIGKITTEMTKDEAVQAITARIPIAEKISAFFKTTQDKLIVARDNLDKGIKMSGDKSKLPGDFMNKLQQLLGFLNQAISFISSNIQGIFNTLTGEVDTIFSFFSVEAKSESYIEFNINTENNQAFIESCNNEISSGLFILESGEYIKNCQFCLTEEMIEENFYDINLISNQCLLEGAKIDWIMKNFMKAPGNYKGLKEDLNQIIAANNLDDTQLKTNKKGILQACKRVLLILNDILVPGGAAATGLGLQKLLPKLGALSANATKVAGTASKVGLISKATGSTITGIAGALSPAAIVGAILSFVIGFIINRIIRLLVDKSDFDNLRNDCYAIVDQLKANAAKTDDPNLKKKYLNAANQVMESVKKYDQSNKPVKPKNNFIPAPNKNMKPVKA